MTAMRPTCSRRWSWATGASRSWRLKTFWSSSAQRWSTWSSASITSAAAVEVDLLPGAHAALDLRQDEAGHLDEPVAEVLDLGLEVEAGAHDGES